MWMAAGVERGVCLRGGNRVEKREEPRRIVSLLKTEGKTTTENKSKRKEVNREQKI